MYKALIGIMVLAVAISGCQSKSNPVEPASTEITGQVEPYIAADTYTSLEELQQAYSMEATSNVRAISEGAEERVYYLADDNILGVSLVDIRVRETYFNCTYDDGISIFSNRYEDDASVLDTFISNNSSMFTKEQRDGYEYYYTADDDYKFYYWLHEGTYMGLRIPAGIDISIEDIVPNLEYMVL